MPSFSSIGAFVSDISGTNRDSETAVILMRLGPLELDSCLAVPAKFRVVPLGVPVVKTDSPPPLVVANDISGACKHRHYGPIASVLER